MAVDFLQKAAGNSATTTLSSGVTNTDTSFPLVSDTNFLAGGGLVIVDEGEATEELAYYTGKSGGALTVPLANRGLEGGSAQAHAAGATVKGVFSADMWNNAVETLVNGFSVTTGAVDSSKIIPASYLDTDGTLAANSDTKIATQKAVKTYVTASVPAVSTDGWTSSSDTWTYASASSFTIAGVDRTTVYTKGTKLKFTQTTAKYAVVVSSSFSTDTTVTIAVNTDYTIANAAITSPFYSYQEKPQGYPARFNFTPAWTNLTVGSGSIPYAFYSVRGDRVFVQVKFIFGSGSSIGGAIYLTAPVAFTTITGIADQDAMLSQCLMLDSGTALYVGGTQYDITNGKIEARVYQADTVYAKYTPTSSTVPMTWTTNDALTIVTSYQI